MKNIITGRAFVYGNNIDTDQIYPGRYLELVDPNEIKAHCLKGVDESFSKEVEFNDIVVAGTNFGCGKCRHVSCSKYGRKKIFTSTGRSPWQVLCWW